MSTRQRAVIYTRVSTKVQDYDRQVKEIMAYVERADLELVAPPFCEKVSGTKTDRLLERKKIIEMARKREIDVVLVLESSRWGRSLSDLISTLNDMWSWGVCLKALNGVSFDFSTATGKLQAGLFALLAEYERDLTVERIKSGLEDAKAKGKKLGRKVGYCPSQEKNTKKVVQFLREGKSIRWIAHELHIGTKTVQRIKNLEVSA